MMDEPYSNIVIPSAPNWFETKIMVYSPDDTLIYGTRCDLMVFKDIASKSALPRFHIMKHAHSKRITSLAINLKWSEKQLLVTAGEDKFVKLWDMAHYDIMGMHQQHLQSEKVIAAEFCGSDKILSVSNDGHVVLWNYIRNEMSHLSNIFGSVKVTVTGCSICPHNPNVAAFGLKTGLILIVDLKGKGSIISKLRGHDKEVVDLDWCPIPFNIFPNDPKNKVVISPQQFIAARGKSHESIVEDETVSNVSTSIEKIPTLEQQIGATVSKISTMADFQELEITASTESVVTSSESQENQQHVAETSATTSSGSDTQKVDQKHVAAKSPGESTSDDSQNDERSETSQSDSSPSLVGSPPDMTGTEQSGRGRGKGRGKRWRKWQKDEDSNKPETSAGPQLRRSKRENNKKLDWPKLGTSTSDTEDKASKSGRSTRASTSTRTPQPSKEDAVKQDKASKSGPSTKASTSTRTPQPTQEDTVKQAQAKLEKSLNIDPCDDENTLVQPKDTKVPCPEEKPVQTSILKKSEPLPSSVGSDKSATDAESKISSESLSTIVEEPSFLGRRPLNPSNLAMLDLITLPPSASRPYCAKCGSEKRCHCDCVKMVAPGVEEARYEYLLVSSAKEPTVIVWRVGTGSNIQAMLRLPAKKSKKSVEKPFISVKWVTPNKIYCSSRNYELIQWTVPKSMNGDGELMKIIDNEHSSIIFSIAASHTDFINKDWVIPTEHLVWTTSQDRLVVGYQLDGDEEEINRIFSYSTFAGIPLCLAETKLNPYGVAIGTGGGVLKLWDLSHSTSRIVSMHNLTQKIHSKVTCATWHPEIETILAFGTQEGRVGFFDISSIAEVPTVMPHYFTKEIHKIQYAPMEDGLGLYIVAEGKLVYWNLTTDENAITPVSTPDSFSVYTFAWKLDYSSLLIAFNLGLILVYSRELIQVDSLVAENKLTCLLWNPLSYTSDITQSSFCMTYAGTLNGKKLLILDHSRQSAKFDEKIVGTFDVADDNINCLSWNRYGTRVAVGTDNGFVYIWDYPTRAVLWNYINPTYQGITCVLFSPVGTEHIFCGTRDHSLNVFRIQEHPPFDAAALSIKRSAVSEAKAEQAERLIEDTLRRVGASPDESQRSVPHKKNELMPCFHRSKLSTEECVSELRRLFNYVQSNCDDADEGAAAAAPPAGEADILDIFGGQQAIESLVARNEEIQRQRRRGLDVPLALFRSDTVDFLREAVNQRQVTPAVVALSPLVSTSLWMQAIEVYADILREDPNSDPYECITYYLAIHQTRAAIDVLLARNLHREALALARCRCPNTDIVGTVVVRWAHYALGNGDFERAAQCFIYVRQFREAALALFRRTEHEIMLFCIELASVSGDSQLLDTAIARYQKYIDLGEYTKSQLETGSIADVLTDARKMNPELFGPGPSVGAGPSTSTTAASEPPATATDDQDVIGALPPFFVAPEPLSLDDEFGASASVTSFVSTGSETFMTRGAPDTSGHVVPIVEQVAIEGETILHAIHSRVTQETRETLRSSASSQDGFETTSSSTSIPDEKKPDYDSETGQSAPNKK
ncbi:unnamed protein product [Acanthoscelides obtectus]|uniref:Uncharacterized protein n=1 Tax=Acanthoscelides obtectus TaxID=200917 RepID=A0A9P0PD98_ACAOB|nr:unnamed protein product [Acanthoscelides obtectus]CAK1628661.1 Gem-associated protein 5 [Acanthoscelides obtectus]